MATGIKLTAAISRDTAVTNAAVSREGALTSAAIAREATKQPLAGTDELEPPLPRVPGQEWYQPSSGVNWTWIISVGGGAWVEFGGSGDDNPPIATQAIAEAGTDNISMMTSLRVKQAIAANTAPRVTAPEIAAGNGASIRRYTVGDIVSLISTWAGEAPPPDDTTPPTRISTTVGTDGVSITDHFSEDMQIGAGGFGGRTFSASGGVLTVGTPTIFPGGDVVWPASRLISPDETITSSYTQPTNGLQDQAATPNDLATFTAQPVINGSGAPTLISSQLQDDGTTLIDTFSEAMQTGAGGGGGRTITASGGPVTLVGPTTFPDGTVVWTTSRIIASDETIDGDYVQPGNGLEAAAGSHVDTPSFVDVETENLSEQSPPTAISPDDVPGLFAWLDAHFDVNEAPSNACEDLDDVFAWLDHSGNSHPVIANASNRPQYLATGLNGEPVISFDASNTETFDLGFTIGAPKPITMLIVFRATSLGNFIIGSVGNGGLALQMGAAVNLVKNNIVVIGSSTTPITTGSTYILAVTYSSGGVYKFWINGVAAGTGTNDQVPSVFETKISGTFNNTGYYNGLLAAVAIWDNVISDSDIVGVTNYYNNLYAAF